MQTISPVKGDYYKAQCANHDDPVDAKGIFTAQITGSVSHLTDIRQWRI